MCDHDVVEKIKKYTPSATFVFNEEKCTVADFTSSNEIFVGSLRLLNQNDKTVVISLINKLKNLEVLNLRKNRLVNITDLSLPKLIHLDLSSNYLGVVPEWIKELNLEFLGLGVNNLLSIPDWIGSLTNLKVLKLHKNKIADVQVIQNCKNLKFLNLYLNSMTQIPEFIFDLEHIEFFSWGLSSVESLSEKIENWKKLQYLSLVANKIKYLPDSICNLKNLIGLRIHKNELQELPKNIGNLEKLEQISLYSNCLKSLPESFLNLKLKKCNLMYNNFVKHPIVKADWLCVDPEDCKWF